MAIKSALECSRGPISVRASGDVSGDRRHRLACQDLEHRSPQVACADIAAMNGGSMAARPGAYQDRPHSGLPRTAQFRVGRQEPGAVCGIVDLLDGFHPGEAVRKLDRMVGDKDELMTGIGQCGQLFGGAGTDGGRSRGVGVGTGNEDAWFEIDAGHCTGQCR